jgi:hypothetical protein
MNDVYDGKPGQSRGGTILAEATHTKSKHLRRFADGLNLVCRFSFSLGMGMGISWDEAVALFRGII